MTSRGNDGEGHFGFATGKGLALLGTDVINRAAAAKARKPKRSMAFARAGLFWFLGAVEPWIDHDDSRVLKVLYVARGQRGIVRAANRGDLRVETVDRPPGTVAVTGDRAVSTRCGCIEGKYLLRER